MYLPQSKTSVMLRVAAAVMALEESRDEVRRFLRDPARLPLALGPERRDVDPRHARAGARGRQGRVRDLVAGRAPRLAAVQLFGRAGSVPDRDRHGDGAASGGP